MKILILGDGLLASKLVNVTNWDYISRKKDNFDIDNFKFNLIDCDTIINCIACTDTYSINKDNHWNVNYKFVANLVDYCNMNNIKLIHISTDYVYTNSVSNASEDDIPIHGNNWYSYTKLLADSYIELRSNNYLICRGSHKSKPFAYKYAWIDQIGNFDYIDVIVDTIIELILSDATGIYNIGTELKTMFNLALQTNKNVIPNFSDHKIPKNISMNITKLKNKLKK